MAYTSKSQYSASETAFQSNNADHVHKTFVIGPWRGYDPREDDWHCVHCNNANYKPYVCSGCLKPRCLNSEELEQLQKSERSGEELFEPSGVLMAEYTEEDLDTESEFLRHHLGLLVQTFSVGQNQFILVAFPFPNCVDFSKNPESAMPSTEEYVRQAFGFKNCRDIEVLNFTKKSLNEMTKDILARKFQIIE
uniref:RanBP2-type domain-containing protein n=1 Tax=Ditylenchus dipsaci TaxID=166011 RepID=A0A915CVI9_9BILA